ncbi:MAG: ABC transporter ATP-binding protein/permease, partial [Beijerinckiaceae bacterium]|nr:ABC transporter ATP-binding protein/permease [Beijerinckiaceae bacterium]MBX9759466.1 ABC transporter ATP-binding protein/permease [Beijerinckiaceae bacterium]
GERIWRAIWLIVVIVIAAALASVLLIHAQTRLKLRWRKWLTQRLVGRWLSERRFYKLSTLHHSETPEARIAEDGRIAIELLVDLAGGVILSIITAIGFIGVLWKTAGSMNVLGYEIPGYMVFASVIYSALLSALTWLTANPLVRSVESKAAGEAQFRYELTRVRDSAEQVALINGEDDERALLDTSLRDLIARWYLVIRDRSRVGLINASNTVLAPVAPLVLVAPKYVAGDMTLGEVMLVAGAFIQVQTALGWLSDNAINVADWFGSARRVAGLQDLFNSLDAISAGAAGIEIGESPDETLRIENLSISLSNGKMLIEDASVAIAPGDRVLFKGESGSGKSTLIRAVAGLWPWGEGSILLPKGARIGFIPQRPYLPLGTLREALLYPGGDEGVSDDDLKSILRRCGLAHLAERLADEENWTQVLSGGEAQRIGFCRALLAKPDILILDEPTSALDEPSQLRMMELIDEELPSATILHVAHRPGLEQFHTREIAIVRKDPEKPGSIVNRPFSIVRGLRKLVRRNPSGRDSAPRDAPAAEHTPAETLLPDPRDTA